MPAGKLVRIRPRRKLNLTQVKQVQKIVNKNKSYRENFIHYQIECNTTGYLLEITSISEATGSDWYDRESNSIQVKHLEIQGDYIADATSNTTRIIVCRSKIGPLVAADFPTTSTQANLDKMEILYDKLKSFYMPTSSATSQLPLIHYKHSFKTGKVPHLNVAYVDAISATAAQKNPLYIWIIGSLAAGATVNAAIGQIKLHYFDKGQ